MSDTDRLYFAVSALRRVVADAERCAQDFPENASLAALASDARAALADYAQRFALAANATAPREVKDAFSMARKAIEGGR